MVKYASSLLVAALVAAPALAQTNWEELDTREYDDLFARHPDEAGLTARESSEQASTSIFARAADFDETFSRRSYGRTADLDAREVDALYERAIMKLDGNGPMFCFYNFIRDAMQQVKELAHAPPSPPVQTSKDLLATGKSKDIEKPCEEKETGKEEEKKKKEQTDSQPAGGKPAGETKPQGPAAGAAVGSATVPPVALAVPPVPPAVPPVAPAVAPVARELSDEDLWERELDDILQERDYSDHHSLYGRGYDDDEDGIYSREYDDAYDLYARSDDTYDSLFARDDFDDLD